MKKIDTVLVSQKNLAQIKPDAIEMKRIIGSEWNLFRYMSDV